MTDGKRVTRRNFNEWIRELDEDVIQGDYGYERGEFSVFPEQWRPLFRKGLTPQQAFRRALDAHKAARDQAEAEPPTVPEIACVKCWRAGPYYIQKDTGRGILYCRGCHHRWSEQH